MTEMEWVKLMAERIAPTVSDHTPSLEVRPGLKLPYGYEIMAYGAAPTAQRIEFQTDLAIIERENVHLWKPRVVIEAKIASITTHDAITYSQKAAAHKAVHPYLRYGIILGDRKHYPLPGRLYRHGVQFDFMMSFCHFEPSAQELRTFTDLLRVEVTASQTLEKILYDSWRRARDHYTVLHRRLELQ